jgi:HAD superfamily hydrolase (TIGR01484 family)
MDATYSISIALFDIDNALVGNESADLPTLRFKNAVKEAKGTIKVAIASARPLSKVLHIIDYIGAEGLAILCNGAQLYDCDSRTVVAEWPIELPTCKSIIQELTNIGIDYWVNDDGIDYSPVINRPDTYDRQQDIWDKDSRRVLTADYVLTNPLVVVVHNVAKSEIKTIVTIVERTSDKTVTSFVAHENMQPDGICLYDMFIVNTRANKKDALEEIARRQHVQLDNILAVGDGRNDAVLVSSAGVGVAMGNSAKETLDVAMFIAPNREDDGAAVALEYFTVIS